MPRNDRNIQYRCERCKSPENVPGSCKCKVVPKTRPVRTPGEIADRILKDVEEVADPTTGLETRQPSEFVAHKTTIDMFITVPVHVRTKIVDGVHYEVDRTINGSEWFNTIEQVRKALKNDGDIDAFIAGLNVKKGGNNEQH